MRERRETNRCSISAITPGTEPRLDQRSFSAMFLPPSFHPAHGGRSAPIRCQHRTESWRCNHNPLRILCFRARESKGDREAAIAVRQDIVCWARRAGPHPEETSRGPKSKVITESRAGLGQTKERPEKVQHTGDWSI